METKMNPQKSVTPSSPEDNVMLDSAETEALPMLPPADETYNQWQQIGTKISTFLAQFPKYFGRFFNEYRQLIVSVALIFAAIITLRVLLAIVNTLNNIPLLAPTFELIGMGYVIWLTFRYLLKAETRQELAVQIRALREQIVGEKAA